MTVYNQIYYAILANSISLKISFMNRDPSSKYTLKKHIG